MQAGSYAQHGSWSKMAQKKKDKYGFKVP